MEEWQAELQRILAKNPEELTDEETGFLNARRHALNNEQRRLFASVLTQTEGEKNNAASTEQPSTPQEPVAPSVPEHPSTQYSEVQDQNTKPQEPETPSEQVATSEVQPEVQAPANPESTQVTEDEYGADPSLDPDQV